MCDHFKYNNVTDSYTYVNHENDLLQVCSDAGELDIFE